MTFRNDERAQALVFLVALLGFAAAAAVALGSANDRLLGQLRAQRAAESAAEAAGVVVGDRLAEVVDEAKLARREARDALAEVVADTQLRAAATAAAREVAAALGASLEGLEVTRQNIEISVRTEVVRQGARATARVGVRAP